jgi:hypothetical protein
MLDEVDESEARHLMDFKPRLDNKVSADYSQERAAAEFKSAILHAYFRTQNSMYPIRRTFVAIFYAIGFAILSIPTIQIFLKVTGILFDLISSSGVGVFWR